MHLDGVHEHTRIVVDALRAAGYAIVVVTARPDDLDYKNKTVTWYAGKNIPYDGFYMRAGGDYRKDDIVKQEIYLQMIEDGWEPVLALDDRQQVVDMWRSIGLPCLQVNPDDSIGRPAFINPEHNGKHFLTMVIGPSGSGKTTLVNSLFPSGRVISSDAVRVELFGAHTAPEAHTPEGLRRTWNYVHGLVKARLEAGLPTVLDTTGIKAKDRKATLDIVPKGQLVSYLVVDRPYDQKLADRGWRPERLIEKHHQTFKQNLKAIKMGDGYPNVMVNMTNCKGDYKIK